MSWKTGSKLFAEMWPLIEVHIPSRDQRVAFTADLLKRLVADGMDTCDVEAIHPDVRAALRRARIAISQPDRYPNEADDGEARPWWRLLG